MKKPLAGLFRSHSTCLFHVRRDELRHLEHGHFSLPAENGLELIIREDVALVGGILQVVLLNVLPDLFRDFRARHRAGTDYCLQFRREIHRL